MTITDEEIRLHLHLGEDSMWAFKRIEFRESVPTSPTRDELADELTAFANSEGRVLVCGVDRDGTIQGLSRDQLTVLDRLLTDLSSDAIKPAIRIKTHHRSLDSKALLLV